MAKSSSKSSILRGSCWYNYSVSQSLVAKFIDQIKRASEAANLVNQVNGIIDSSRIDTNAFSC